MYRAIGHRHPTINGYSGYSPPHYDKLRAAIANHDETGLDSIGAFGPLAGESPTRPRMA